jgi:formamidopyrimidine-DNA glycosylase
MPELPEVEAVRRALRRIVSGKRIRRVRVVHAIAVRPQGAREIRRAAGQRIRGIERRGKYLLLKLEKGWLALHFRLDGQVLWFAGEQPKSHACVIFELARGSLGFVDPRHLGRVHYYRRQEECAGLRRLGMEPLSAEFTAEQLQAMLRQSRRPLKVFLMDQTRIAGLGNIYSSEALWRAGLNPWGHADEVKPEEARRVHKAIVEVLRAALECCLDPPPDFRNPQWWFQGLEAILGVYGREGKPCRRCGAIIQRITQAGRSTYFCPKCQRQPGGSTQSAKETGP